jgi:predicted cupin superfamily sugar epimerase
MISADEIISKFGLEPLPEEGGYYAETYRSDETIPKSVLPRRYKSDKVYGTAIYYLITPDSFSALHRLPTDENFHFYLGDPVIMLQLFEDGSSKKITLGQQIMEDQYVQVVVPKGTWQGSFLADGGRFAFMGTTMAPGFDFSDYESGSRNELINQYPDRKDLIIRLTEVGNNRNTH